MLEPVNLLGVEGVVQHNGVRASVSVGQHAIQGLKQVSVMKLLQQVELISKIELDGHCLTVMNHSPLLEQKIQVQQWQPCRQA